MKMTCVEIEQSIPWLLDDELGSEIADEVETHVRQCESCRAALMREGNLRVALRRATTPVVASAALRRKVSRLLSQERRRRIPLYRLAPAAAAAVILAAFIWRGATGGASNSDFDVLARVPDLPMDVVAADVSQVQSYFNSKLPFAVRLPRMSEGAASSFGGRVMHMRDRDAAYVRYNTQRGQVSVFVYEDSDDEPSEVAPMYRFGDQRVVVKEVRGYTVAKWRSAGVTYSVVSDLPARELTTLVHAAP